MFIYEIYSSVRVYICIVRIFWGFVVFLNKKLKFIIQLNIKHRKILLAKMLKLPFAIFLKKLLINFLLICSFCFISESGSLEFIKLKLLFFCRVNSMKLVNSDSLFTPFSSVWFSSFALMSKKINYLSENFNKFYFKAI